MILVWVIHVWVWFIDDQVLPILNQKFYFVQIGIPTPIWSYIIMKNMKSYKNTLPF